MSEIDLTPLQTILAEFIPQGRTALLPALHAAQKHYGYLPEPVAAAVGQALKTPLADVHGVIEFYTMLRAEPGARTVVQVCADPACAMRGADRVLQSLDRHLDTDPAEPNGFGAFEVEVAPCLGMCEHAPAVLLGDRPVGQVDPQHPEAILTGEGQVPWGRVYGSPRILTANCGRGKTTSLQEYLDGGGYAGLKRALSMPPQKVVAQVMASGLVGRGGAAFPTGLKWEGAAQAPGDIKYVVCNADESEPGTFKDRVLLEEDPHRTLEGMLIAAYATGAQYGYIYIRGEYPRAYEVVAQAVEEARQAGFLGQNIAGSDFDFDLELRLGAGAYICGEETALFESIEGKRGFPRIKPPFPTTHGLFGMPTVINNVETLCNVPYILEKGPDAYRALGTERSPGTKLFCLSGDVGRPGLYEVAFGRTMRELILDLAGGVPGGRKLKTVLLGGAAGAFAAGDDLDVPLTFEDLREAGLPLGSGVLMVFDERRDPLDALRRIARFFAHESCGKCYPCQMGTQRQLEILERLSVGDVLSDDAARLTDVGWTMVDSSLCGLGQTAATAVLSAIRLWPELFITPQPPAAENV